MLQLNTTIGPGEYYLEVLADNPNSTKPAIDRQWTDFEVLP